MSKPRVLYLSSWPIGAYGEGAVSFIYEQIKALSSVVDPLFVQMQFIGLFEWGRRSLFRSNSERITDLWNSDVQAVRLFTPRITPRFTNRSILEDVARAGKVLARRIVMEYGRPDIVHAHAVLPAGLLGASISTCTGVPLLLQEHSAPFEMHLDTEAKRAHVMQVFESATRIAPVGGDLASRIEALGVPKSKLTKIPEMVSTDRFLPKVMPTQTTPLRIISIGSLEERKGFELLINAVSTLRSRGTAVQLSIVGEGPLRNELGQLVLNLGLAEAVEFLGHLSRASTADAIARSHVYVCASTRETFGIAPAEALSVGRPVVTMKCGGPEEYVNSQDGHVVSEREPDALAEGILNVARRIEMFDPDALHNRIDQRFGPGQFRSRVLDLYSSMSA